MTYITREMFEERTKGLNAAANGKIFLESVEGRDEKFVNFLETLKTDEATHYYAKNLQLYLYCRIMDWMIENDFLANRKKDGSRAVLASDIAMMLLLEMKG